MSTQPNATPVFTSGNVGPTAEAEPSFVEVVTETSGVAPVATVYTGSVGNSPSGVIHSKGNPNAGAIAGGVVGGLVVVAIAVVALYWIRRRYPKVRNVETGVVSAPPHYDMPYSNAGGVTQPAHTSTREQPPYVVGGEQPSYVYKSEGLGAKEEMRPVTCEKHVKQWPVDKKM